jgi:hypothetical protein
MLHFVFDGYLALDKIQKNVIEFTIGLSYKTTLGVITGWGIRGVLRELPWVQEGSPPFLSKQARYEE